jgi:hypothetical protein
MTFRLLPKPSFGHICGQVLFPKSLTIFGRLSALLSPLFLKRDAKVMEIISSPNFIEINFNFQP